MTHIVARGLRPIRMARPPPASCRCRLRRHDRRRRRGCRGVRAPAWRRCGGRGDRPPVCLPWSCGCVVRRGVARIHNAVSLSDLFCLTLAVSLFYFFLTRFWKEQRHELLLSAPLNVSAVVPGTGLRPSTASRVSRSEQFNNLNLVRFYSVTPQLPSQSFTISSGVAVIARAVLDFFSP